MGGDADVRIRQELRFRGVRRTRGEVDAWGGGTPSLCDARVDCQLGVAPKLGTICVDCPRLLGWQCTDDGQTVVVDCVWTHADPVSARMTCLDALICVPPTVSCAFADRVAAREAVHRVLIVDDGELVGIACRHDLARRPAAPVAECMQRLVYVVAASATLGEAAEAMAALHIGCLPVVRERRLVGILTRGDLVRAGVRREELLR